MSLHGRRSGAFAGRSGNRARGCRHRSPTRSSRGGKRACGRPRRQRRSEHAHRALARRKIAPMNTQTIRGEAFAALHRRPTIFAIPNPWDAGSAKVLAALGFEALATTSAGLSFALGKPDGEGEVTRDETLANARAIVDA